MHRSPDAAIMGPDTRAVVYWLEEQQLLGRARGTFCPCHAAPTEAAGDALRVTADDHPAYSLSLLFPDAQDAESAAAWTWVCLSPGTPITYRTVRLAQPALDTAGVVRTPTEQGAFLVVPDNPVTGMYLHTALEREFAVGVGLTWPASATGVVDTPMLLCSTGNMDYAMLTCLVAADAQRNVRISRFTDTRTAAMALADRRTSALWCAAEDARPVWEQVTEDAIRGTRLPYVADGVRNGLPGTRRIMPWLLSKAREYDAAWLITELETM